LCLRVENTRSITGRCGLVTGGSRGLGRAVALELGRRGWAVCVNYRSNTAAAERTLCELHGMGAEAFAWQADVCDRAAVGEMFDAVRGRWGRLDLLVNNAGISRQCLLPRMTEAEWDEVMGTDFLGALNCCRAAVRLCESAGDPCHIINIASISGLRGRAGQSHYAAAKGALIGLTQSLAVEVGPMGIRVNAVLPGYLPTEMGMASPAAMEAARNEHCLGCLGDAGDAARFIADLAESRTITGQVLRVDGRL